MKLPRDVDGKKLSGLLRGHGYLITRQTGSHIRLTSSSKGAAHHVTIPAHKEIRVGTLHEILRETATYLETDLAKLIEDLFGR